MIKNSLLCIFILWLIVLIFNEYTYSSNYNPNSLIAQQEQYGLAILPMQVQWSYCLSGNLGQLKTDAVYETAKSFLYADAHELKINLKALEIIYTASNKIKERGCK